MMAAKKAAAKTNKPPIPNSSLARLRCASFARARPSLAPIQGMSACLANWRRSVPREPERHGTADIGEPFTLIDHRGNQVSDQDFRGRPLLVAFGYTNCPDVCQMMLQNISEALNQVGDRTPEIEPLFISFDPGRDTVSVMAAHHVYLMDRNGLYINHFSHHAAPGELSHAILSVLDR
jgi:cytochrome oxidase Cu insertion factor (SCO1/SenC/PrrC family)